MEADDASFGVISRVHTQPQATTQVNGHIQDVDDILLSGTKTSTTGQKSGQSKLDHAREMGRKTTDDLRTLVEGLDTKVRDIGIVVAEAQNYTGSERIFNALGKFGMSWAKNKASVLRHDRLQQLDLSQAVLEIKHYVESTIHQLGESELEYKNDLTTYNGKIAEVLNKQSEATPKYIDAQVRRQKLEGEIQSIEDELKAGTLSQLERPEKEQKLEVIKRQFDATLLEEKTLAAIVKEAAEALPTLQKNREATNQSIQSLHSMRQGMLEKFNNLNEVLARAATAMKAAAKADLYKSVDPTFNKSIEVITANNVATAGALLETWAERMKHAAIDPEASQRLLNELLGHIADAAKDLSVIEEDMKVRKI